MVTKLAILVLTCFLYACFSTGNLINGEVDNNTLKLRGCYSTEFEGVDCEKRHSIYFLYENGVILYAGSPCDFNLEKYLKESLTDDFHRHTVDQSGDLTNWGSLNIQQRNISFEIYSPPSFGAKAKTVTRYGKILTDTTFIMTKSIYHNDKYEEINEKYYFIPMESKPDSTNNFIKLKAPN